MDVIDPGSIQANLQSPSCDTPLLPGAFLYYCIDTLDSMTKSYIVDEVSHQHIYMVPSQVLLSASRRANPPASAPLLPKDSKVAYINTFCSGIGMGSLMLGEFCRFMRSQGVAAVALRSIVGRSGKTYKFYTSHGFVPQDFSTGTSYKIGSDFARPVAVFADDSKVHGYSLMKVL